MAASRGEVDRWVFLGRDRGRRRSRARKRSARAVRGKGRRGGSINIIGRGMNRVVEGFSVVIKVIVVVQVDPVEDGRGSSLFGRYGAVRRRSRRAQLKGGRRFRTRAHFRNRAGVGEHHQRGSKGSRANNCNQLWKEGDLPKIERVQDK
jgi:hypothetical protein